MNFTSKISFKKLRDMIFSFDFKCFARKKAGYFSRESPLSFITMMVMMLKLVKKSMQIELNELFDELGKEDFVSKQAFSQARQKIRWEAFEELYNDTVRTAAESDEVRYFKDKYRLLAVDGTTLPLESTKELIKHFGCSGGSKTACTARVSVLQDVYHGILYDAKIGSYRAGERKFAIKHLKKLENIDDRENIVVFDRGYVSDELIAECFKYGHYFVMRIRERWHAKLIEETESGNWLTIKHKGKDYRVRVIKLILENGNPEVLFSNIDFLDEDEFGDIYALRWTIETKYDTIKNIIQLENASGLSVDSVYQDFFACMTIANNIAFLKLDADTIINKNNQNKGLKREYQASNAIIMGMLRQYFVRMVVCDDPEKQEYYMDKFFNAIVRFSDVKQPHRSYPRIDKTQRRRFPLRKKPVL
jgi:hypothetical protein